jgi:hypothetical protein
MGVCFKDFDKWPWCSWKLMRQLIAMTLIQEKYCVVCCKGEGMFSSPRIFFFTILGCHSNGYHPKEALVKSNYKQDMKVLYSKNPFYNINLTIW